MSSSTKSIVAKAAQCRSHNSESTHPHPLGPMEKQGGPGLWHAGSENSRAGMATRSLGTWLRVRKGGREPGRMEELLDGRRRLRRSRSFEVTSCGVGAGTE